MLRKRRLGARESEALRIVAAAFRSSVLMTSPDFFLSVSSRNLMRPKVSVIRKLMEIDFDPEKNAWNVAERGLAFSLAADFKFETALIWADMRKDYGEARTSPWGSLGGVFTPWSTSRAT